MKKTLTSRLEILLAKIAGKDVSLETMTPPVASNMTEQLMLDIADRIDDIESATEGGGSGGSFNSEEDVYTIYIDMDTEIGKYVSIESSQQILTHLLSRSYKNVVICYLNFEEDATDLVTVGRRYYTVSEFYASSEEDYKALSISGSKLGYFNITNNTIECSQLNAYLENEQINDVDKVVFDYSEITIS